MINENADQLLVQALAMTTISMFPKLISVICGHDNHCVIIDARFLKVRYGLAKVDVVEFDLVLVQRFDAFLVSL